MTIVSLTVLIFLEELQHTPHVKVKISFNIFHLSKTLQSPLQFSKFTPSIRSLASILFSLLFVSCSFIYFRVFIGFGWSPIAFVLEVLISRSLINCSGLSMVYPLLFRILYPRVTPSPSLIMSIIFPRFHFDFGLLSSESSF